MASLGQSPFTFIIAKENRRAVAGETVTLFGSLYANPISDNAREGHRVFNNNWKIE